MNELKLPSDKPLNLWDDVNKRIIKEICDNCHGTGGVRGNANDEDGSVCPKCKGSGRNQTPITCKNCQRVNLNPQINNNMPHFSPLRYIQPKDYKCESCGKPLE